jgi:hypothetical protein
MPVAKKVFLPNESIMKKVRMIISTVVIGLLSLGMVTNLSAQEEVLQVENLIKVKPLSFEFAYERLLNDFVSLQASARFFPVNISANDGEGDVHYSNYRIMAEARFYVASRKGAPQGFFIAPYLKAGLTSLSAETESNTDLTSKVKFKGTSFGAGLTLGWQWVKKSGFSIDTQFGWGYTRTNFKDIKVRYSDGTSELERAPVDNLSITLPTISFSIGYAF